jgi:hypothetical protein
MGTTDYTARERMRRFRTRSREAKGVTGEGVTGVTQGVTRGVTVTPQVIENSKDVTPQSPNKAAPIYNPSLSFKESESLKARKKEKRERVIRAPARGTQLVLWESSPPPVPAALEKVSFPADFVLTPRLVEMAAQMAGWNFGRANLEFHKFNAYYRREGRQFADWDAAWMSWCLNGAERDAKAKNPDLQPTTYYQQKVKESNDILKAAIYGRDESESSGTSGGVFNSLFSLLTSGG